jgi:hypothetical protein
MASSSVTLNTAGMEEFWGDMLATLESAVKVGVLQTSNARDDGTTNAAVGLKNEFGDPSPSQTTRAEETARGRGPMAWEGTPKRSFLRMPLMERLPVKITSQADTLRAVVEGQAPGFTLAEAIGELAVETVQEAFDTSGFGEWPANSPSTVAWKGSTQPLIDSHQLRESIQSEVVPA